VEDLSVHGGIILKLRFKNKMTGHGLNLSGSGQRQEAGSCQRGSEPSGLIKCREFLDHVRNF
jgi:hypothetical protein